MSFNFAVAARHGEVIQNVINALSLETAKLSDEQKEHNEEVKSTVADSVRAFAKAMLNDGITPKDADDTLRESLKLAGVPKGTALNYGRAASGFMVITVNGGDMYKASVKDAQDAMATPEQKEKIAARDALKPYLRDGTAEQLQAILKFAESLEIKLKERKVRSDKANAQVQEAQAA